METVFNPEDELSPQDKEIAKTKGYVEKTNQPFFWQKRKLQVTVKGWHYCCALALSAVMSGQFSGYNPGFAAGIGGFTLIVVIISIGYTLLGACIGELASAIPFCGGSYGYTRFVFGKIPGYIIGVIESFEYVLLITTSCFFCGTLVGIFTETSDNISPLWWFLIYLVIWFLQMRGGKLMWDVLGVLCIVNIVILIIFFLATTKWMNMHQNAPLPSSQPWFTTDSSVFFQSFPFAMWLFIGLEVIPMISEEVEEPHKAVPKGLRISIWVLIVCSFLIMYAVAALPPPNNGTLLDTASAVFPCQEGWTLVFGSTSNVIGLMSFLPIWNNDYAIAIGASRQLFAMSRSGYLPSILSLTSEKGVPYVAATTLILVCFFLDIICFYSPNPARFFNGMFNAATIAGISNYIVQLSCFIVWRYKHTSITRQYRSPYGVPGAVLAICIFGVGLGTMFAYTPHITDAVITLIVFLTIAIIYYLAYARFHLTLSPEEIHALFPVYSVMVLEGKWKKVHQNQGQKGSKGSKGHSSPNASRNKLPAVELEPINTSQKDQNTEESSRQLFNPFIDSLPKQEPELTLTESHSTLDSTELFKTPQSQQEFAFNPSPLPDLSETTLSSGELVREPQESVLDYA